MNAFPPFPNLISIWHLIDPICSIFFHSPPPHSFFSSILIFWIPWLDTYATSLTLAILSTLTVECQHFKVLYSTLSSVPSLWWIIKMGPVNFSHRVFWACIQPTLANKISTNMVLERLKYLHIEATMWRSRGEPTRWWEIIWRRGIPAGNNPGQSITRHEPPHLRPSSPIPATG